ncbi:AbrB family transcriptional regulator [Cytobacillus purgationiresistens]|uniref:Membrane AbrB-like protein n=1 Tax=Cytobacillus purgationiresistens TaxID=863449 RepID=A0ABU0AAN4_9BACI|nr:AbrB family transcriptional regulator [Cytobacillus purgationiresistens]MDQ0268307.1 membrane AbrB-like protein [Cytobacillus purgationiresistens]
MNSQKFPSMVFAFLLASLCGLIFHLLHIPVGWLLGSIASIMIFTIVTKKELHWPPYLRNIGILIIGYSMGLSLTKEALIFIGHQLPSMLLMTVFIVLLSALTAFLISKLTGINYPSVLIGSIPGGLSQMMILAEETKGVNVTVVTFLQVIRLIMIIFLVPFLIFGPLFGEEQSFVPEVVTPHWSGLFPNLIVFAVVAIVFALLFKKMGTPTPFLLGPILGTALLGLIGFNGPELPIGLLDLSQILIGVNIGLMMHPEKLEHKTKLITLALVSSTFLILGSLFLSFVLSQYFHFSEATSFLSLSPGGMDQMAIIAHEVGADLSVVTGYQLFRLFFIFFAVPPLLKWIFKKSLKYSSSDR